MKKFDARKRQLASRRSTHTTILLYKYHYYLVLGTPEFPMKISKTVVCDSLQHEKENLLGINTLLVVSRNYYYSLK
jgi:hypothetical protein